MAFLTMTYSFTNSTTADATQVNTNFQDVIDATSDGTIDFNVNALTAAGAAVLNGHVTLGSASADDLTVNASLASSIPIKTTRTYDIGSADLGLRILYLGGNSTHTSALQAPSSGMSGDVNFVLPPTNGTSGFVLKTDGSGNTSWAGAGGSSSIRVCDGNGHGGSSSGETTVRNFTTTLQSTGSAITYTARTTTTGDKFTINEDGIYAISAADRENNTTYQICITKNSTGLSTVPTSITSSEVLDIGRANDTLDSVNLSVTVRLAAGDVIRLQADGTSANTDNFTRFCITQICKI